MDYSARTGPLFPAVPLRTRSATQLTSAVPPACALVLLFCSCVRCFCCSACA